MTTIVGGKAKKAREICAFLESQRKHGQPFYEPFVGGANIVSRMKGERWASDNNPYLVAYYQAMQNDWLPPEFLSKEVYDNMRKNPLEYPPELVGYVGHGYSFGAKWFGSYSAREDNATFRKEQLKKNVKKWGEGHKNGRCSGNSAHLRARERYFKLHPLLKGVHFLSLNYWELEIPDGSMVYCDPPYADTTQAYFSTEFDSAAFWSWAEDLSERCDVYVSEYKAPPSWESVWQKEVPSTLASTSNSKKRIETLWKLKTC